MSRMEYFLTSFDDMDGICYKYSFSNWRKYSAMCKWMKNLERCYFLDKFGQHNWVEE
jgi:hypothetical protein